MQDEKKIKDCRQSLCVARVKKFASAESIFHMITISSASDAPTSRVWHVSQYNVYTLVDPFDMSHSLFQKNY